MSAPQFHTLKIADIRRETPEAVSIAFAVPDNLRGDFAFTPGQYLTLRRMTGGEDQRRSYSVCSGLDDGDLRIAVKKVDGGLFSTFANDDLKVGDAIDVMTPMGRFVVPETASHPRKLLAIAAGSGITPILSIVKTVLAREPESRFVLLYGNKSSQTIMFKQAIEDLKDVFLDRFAVHHVLSREAQDVAISHGRLDGERIAALLATVDDAQSIDHAFLCGPKEMIDAARATLIAKGVSADRIHSELFTPSTPLRLKPAVEQSEAAATATVTFEGANHVVPLAEGETVIDAARRAGLELPYSCKGGMCCTCRAKVTSGDVEMIQNFSLEPWEVEQGFVLACQCLARSANVSLDFDQL